MEKNKCFYVPVRTLALLIVSKCIHKYTYMTLGLTGRFRREQVKKYGLPVDINPLKRLFVRICRW